MFTQSVGKGSKRWHNSFSSLRRSECYTLSPPQIAFWILKRRTNNNDAAVELLIWMSQPLRSPDNGKAARASLAPCGSYQELLSSPNHPIMVATSFPNHQDALSVNIYEAVMWSPASIFTCLALIFDSFNMSSAMFLLSPTRLATLANLFKNKNIWRSDTVSKLKKMKSWKISWDPSTYFPSLFLSVTWSVGWSHHQAWGLHSWPRGTETTPYTLTQKVHVTPGNQQLFP